MVHNATNGAQMPHGPIKWCTNALQEVWICPLWTPLFRGHLCIILIFHRHIQDPGIAARVAHAARVACAAHATRGAAHTARAALATRDPTRAAHAARGAAGD